MKKVLVCALAALFLMASCLTAFAETPEYVTTTSYVTEDGVTSLNVRTVVSGATNGTMLTYLAYTGDSATDDTVKFIDQKTSDGSDVVFDYTTAKENLTNVTVKFGTSAEDNAYPIEKTLDENARVITVNVVGVGNDTLSDTITLPSAAGNTIELTEIEVPTDYNLVSAVINETDVASLIDYESGIVKVTDNEALFDDAVINITFEEPYKYPVAVSSTAAGCFVGMEAGQEVEKMTVFGIADTNIAVDEGDWGGMLLSSNGGDFKYGDDGVTAYAAKFRDEDGRFAVQLVNKGDKELTTNTWYARAYVKASTGNYAYGPVEVFEPIVEAE